MKRWKPFPAPRISLIIALLGSSPFSILAAVDLTVANIEVTQSIQTPANTVQLIARRSTAVRVTVGVTGSASAVANVNGRLHVFVNGSEVTPASGLLPINTPFTAPLAPQRGNQNDTLNFELPSPTPIPASTDVDFHVDVNPVPGEVNTSNNGGDVNNLTFVDRTPPLLYFTSINYIPSGLGLPSAALIQPGVGDAFVRGILPVHDVALTADPALYQQLYQQGLFASLSFNEDPNGNLTLDARGSEGDDLLNLLESCRQLIVDHGTSPGDRVFLYGWVAGSVNGNGLGQTPGHVAFGNTDPVRYQRSFAHELSHNFGFNHLCDPPPSAGCPGIGQVGWDVGSRLPNNPAGNNVTGRLKPTTLFDRMVPGRLTAEAWTDIAGYNTLVAHPWLAASSPDSTTNVYWIRGIFSTSGQELLRLDPVFRYAWPVQLRGTVQGRSQYVVRVTDSLGNVTTVPFSAQNHEDADGTNNPPVFGFFSVMLPLTAPSINLLQVASLDASKEFGRIQRSASPPEVRILSPESGAQLPGKSSLELAVKDADTALAQLQYQIAYSPDDGRTWTPLRVNVSGDTTKIFVNLFEVQKTKGRGRIRVYASDGLNTSFADVSRLTPLEAVYENPSEPTLQIAQTRGKITFSWLRSETKFTVQSSRDLKTWLDLTNPPPVVVSNMNTVTITTEGSGQFFQLRQ